MELGVISGLKGTTSYTFVRSSLIHQSYLVTHEKALEDINPKKIIQKKELVHFYLHEELSFPAWPQGWKDPSVLLIHELILSIIRS